MLLTIDKDESYINACKEYNEYILEHRNNVKIAYNNLFENTDVIYDFCKECNIKPYVINYSENLKNILESNVETHDESKFSDEEFDAYRLHFHCTKDEKARIDNDEIFAKNEEFNFQEAWQHHYTNNPHHPEYWYDFESKMARPMTSEYLLEMLCDWEAMSIKFKSKTIDWLRSDDGKEVLSIMHPETIKQLKVLIRLIYGEEM